MDRSRILVSVSVGIILGITILSGPAIGLLDLTTPRFDTDGLGQGNATVDDIDAPERVMLDRGLQSESYTVKVPDARIHVASIDGRPLVSYKLSIREMGYSRATTHFLDPDDQGWVRLSVSQDTLGPEQVTRSEYEGTLSIVLRANENEWVLYEKPVPVEVTE